MESTPWTGAGHLTRIDVLRGIACLMVVAFHYFAATFGRERIDCAGLIDGSVPHPGWDYLLLYPLRFGAFGVSLFFVISGYVIHRSYLRSRRFTWVNYAARRFWRIYPAYFVALLGFSAWQHVIRTRDFTWHAALVHNFSAQTFFGINISFWSLAVEVQLYLLYPIAILVRRWGGVTGMLVVGILASAIWRTVEVACLGWPGPATLHLWVSPIALWPDWLLGAYLADRHATGQQVFRRPIVWICCGVVALALGEFVTPIQWVQFSVASVISAAVVDFYLRGPESIGRSARVLVVFGTCSYSLYLIHQPFMGRFVGLLASLGIPRSAAQLLVGLPVYTVAIGCLAWTMYAVVERGGVKVGNRLSAVCRRVFCEPRESRRIEG